VLLAVVAVGVVLGAGYYLGKRSTSSSTTTTVATTTTTSPPPTTTTSTTLAVAACQGSQFTGAMAPSQGAAGTIYTGVTLNYRGASPCQMIGWPTVRLYDASSNLMASRTVRSSTFFSGQPGVPGAPSLLRVTTGTTVHFALAYSDIPVGTEACSTVDHLAVNLPLSYGNGNAIIVSSAEIAPCGHGTIYVSPLYI
jgi:hypothetical protein